MTDLARVDLSRPECLDSTRTPCNRTNGCTIVPLESPQVLIHIPVISSVLLLFTDIVLRLLYTTSKYHGEYYRITYFSKYDIATIMLVLRLVLLTSWVSASDDILT